MNNFFAIICTLILYLSWKYLSVIVARSCPFWLFTSTSSKNEYYGNRIKKDVVDRFMGISTALAISAVSLGLFIARHLFSNHESNDAILHIQPG